MVLNTIRKYNKLVKKRGYVNSVKHHIIQLLSFLFRPYLKITNQNTYKLNKTLYPYYISTYGATWASERCVEVPIFMKLLNQGLAESKQILEIGNVLEHYRARDKTWDVVDKYEVSKDVVNEDIATYNPNKKYDLILSVSTMEHVGFDEDIIDDKKIERSIKHIMQNLLLPNGVFIYSVPVSYNPAVDKILANEVKQNKDNIFFLKRNGILNWSQVDFAVAQNTKYGESYFGSSDAISIVVLNSRKKVL